MTDEVVGLTVICAWCSKVLQMGRGPVSHGLCWRCAEQHFPQNLKAIREVCPHAFESIREDHDKDRAPVKVNSSWGIVYVDTCTMTKHVQCSLCGETRQSSEECVDPHEDVFASCNCPDSGCRC